MCAEHAPYGGADRGKGAQERCHGVLRAKSRPIRLPHMPPHSTAQHADPAFAETRVLLNIQLSPRFVNQLPAGVQTYILSRLFKYEHALGGVPVACPRVRFCGAAAQVPGDFPFINCSVDAAFVVFAPKVGQILRGTVNQTSADHVGLLVNGTFNASIAASELTQGMWYDESESAWKLDDGSLAFPDASEVTFEVLSLDVVESMLDIRGALKSIIEAYDCVECVCICDTERMYSVTGL
jgi:DNA-directed RNA polymerase subunit E'/Rpb7